MSRGASVALRITEGNVRAERLVLAACTLWFHSTMAPIDSHERSLCGRPFADGGDWANARVYTIGHSTRPQAELISLLRRYGVATLVDIRTIPRSRHNPQFNRDELEVALPAAGIRYVHLSRLGGLRRGSGAESPNNGWHNASFRAYADYMQTDDFRQGLEELRALTEAGPVALMCAEAVPWRCHRSLVADALTIRGVDVDEIRSLTRTERHKLTPFAHVDGLRLTYPAAESDG